MASSSVDAASDSSTTPVPSSHGIDRDPEKVFPKEPEPTPEADPNIVRWTGPDDRGNPQNWTFTGKAGVTGIWVYACLATAIGSSIFSSGSQAISAEFHVSSTVVTLGVSLFMIGYCVGPPIWGPLSEHFGRKWPAVIGMSMFTVFCIPAAVGQNMATILVSRFFQGAFGAAPLALIGGALVDIWNPIQRSVALTCCVGTLFWSPSLAPVIGDFVTENVGWRWTQWISCIMGGICALLLLVALPETYAPLLLRQRAARLRKDGFPDARSQFDGKALTISDIARIYLIRAFMLLATEPILIAVTIYQAFIYGMLYLFYVAYPIVFEEIRHWNLGISSLPFLGIVAGVLCGCAVVIAHILITAKPPKMDKDGKPIIIPEERLPIMIIGSILVPVGLFIFAWTSNPDIHWIGMAIGGFPIGMGMYMIFVQCFNYIIDVYMTISNSAIAGNTMVRSGFAAAFPLFGPAMFHRLGVEWATSLLAFLSLAMILIPVLFWKYGAQIRARSKNRIST